MSYNSPFTGNVIQPTDVSYRSIELSANLQLQWPINGSTTDDVAARIMEVTATTTGLSLLMPPADQSSVGNDALIRNIGTNAITVLDYNGVDAICTVSAGQAKYIYITSNPDNQGYWGVIAYGAGSSNADAATLAGYGLMAIGTTLNQTSQVVTFTSNTGISTAARASTYVAIGGTCTLTLDSVGVLQNNWFVFVRNSGTGTLTVTGNGVDQIDGSLSLAFQPGDSAIVVCSGSAFYTVGLGKSTQFNYTLYTKAVTGGDYTLTAQEASNVIQQYTGTLTSNVRIIVPPTVQVYFIQNQTDGTVANYTITVTTDLGGADAVVPSNQQVTLVCDSVNLLNANTYQAGSSSIGLVDGTVGAPSLYFSLEPTTGIYRATGGQFNTAVLGVNRSTLSATGLTINGSGTFVNGISGGTF
jgi:hypothetical protein